MLVSVQKVPKHKQAKDREHHEPESTQEPTSEQTKVRAGSTSVGHRTPPKLKIQLKKHNKFKIKKTSLIKKNICNITKQKKRL